MNDTIFLIEGNTDILKIKNDIARYDKSKLFTLDYVSHKLLAENNIKHEIAENYLTNEDRQNIDDYSIHAAITWYEHVAVKELLTFEGINLGSLIEMELLHYFVNMFGTAFMIKKIIQKEYPKQIISYTSFHDYIKLIAKNVEVISYDFHQSSLSQFNKINIKYNLGSHPISFTVSRNTFLKIKKILEMTLNFLFKLNPNLKSKKKSILLIDFNPTQYDILLKELSKLDKNILLLNQRRPAIWNLHSFNIIKNSNCKIISLNIFEKEIEENINHTLKTLSNNLEKLDNLNSIFEELFSINSQTFWYSIKNTFLENCSNRFKESVKRILLLNEMFNQFNISVILEWAETAQEEKEIVFVSKNRGIKSIVLQHAMDPLSNTWKKYHRFVLGGYSSFISDKQALWGKLVKELALSYGNKEENLILTGSPRHDTFFQTDKNTGKNGMILFATTSVSGRISFEHTTIEAYEKFHDYVREVCNVVRKLPDVHLVVKPHPQPDFLSNITKIVQEIDPHIPILHNVNLADLINSCDLLITFNNSTVALESMILDKPTISLQIEKWAEEDPISKSGSLLSIVKVSDVEEGIKSMLYDEELKEKILLNSRNFVGNYLANPGNASKALAKILDSF